MMNKNKENENERSPAKPCRRCGALLGWISGCGNAGDYDYEPEQKLTECICTRSRDEVCGCKGESQ